MKVSNEMYEKISVNQTKMILNPIEKIEILGFNINFYKAGLFLPEDFLTEHKIHQYWNVSI